MCLWNCCGIGTEIRHLQNIKGFQQNLPPAGFGSISVIQVMAVLRDVEECPETTRERVERSKLTTTGSRANPLTSFATVHMLHGRGFGLIAYYAYV